MGNGGSSERLRSKHVNLVMASRMLCFNNKKYNKLSAVIQAKKRNGVNQYY